MVTSTKTQHFNLLPDILKESLLQASWLRTVPAVQIDKWNKVEDNFGVL